MADGKAMCPQCKRPKSNVRDWCSCGWEAAESATAEAAERVVDAAQRCRHPIGCTCRLCLALNHYGLTRANAECASYDAAKTKGGDANATAGKPGQPVHNAAPPSCVDGGDKIECEFCGAPIPEGGEGCPEICPECIEKERQGTATGEATNVETTEWAARRLVWLMPAGALWIMLVTKMPSWFVPALFVAIGTGAWLWAVAVLVKKRWRKP